MAALRPPPLHSSQRTCQARQAALAAAFTRGVRLTDARAVEKCLFKCFRYVHCVSGASTSKSCQQVASPREAEGTCGMCFAMEDQQCLGNQQYIGDLG